MSQPGVPPSQYPGWVPQQAAPQYPGQQAQYSAPQYPVQQPVPPQPAPPARPSAWWMGAGILVIIAGVISAIVVGISGFTDMSDTVDGFQRVEVPGSGDVQLAANHDYTVYLEYSGATDSDVPGQVRGRLTDPSGQVVDWQPYSSSVTYQFGHREGRAEFSFHATQSGTYHLESEGGPDVTIAVGGGLGSSIAGTILTAFVIVGLSLLLGVLAIVVVLVLRSRSRRTPAPAVAPRAY